MKCVVLPNNSPILFPCDRLSFKSTYLLFFDLSAAELFFFPASIFKGDFVLLLSFSAFPTLFASATVISSFFFTSAFSFSFFATFNFGSSSLILFFSFLLDFVSLTSLSLSFFSFLSFFFLCLRCEISLES